jgi:hypothetical protein
MSITTVFFTGENLKRMLTYLCNSRPPDVWDPITATVIDILTCKLQFCLTTTGLLPFKGKANLLYPYHMMTEEQKEFLRQSLSDSSTYVICNDSVVFNTDQEKLDPVLILEAMCCKVLDSKVHKDRNIKLGVCNILLQRVQSMTPISKGSQQRLNTSIFSHPE